MGTATPGILVGCCSGTRAFVNHNSAVDTWNGIVGKGYIIPRIGNCSGHQVED